MFNDSVMGAVRTNTMIGLILGRGVPDNRHGLLGPAAHLRGLGEQPRPQPGRPAHGADVVYIILGCLIDGISMVVLTAAVVMPAVKAAGIDLVWFGIFVVLVVEMAQITPPVGFNLFVIQGLTGRSLGYIALAALPFFLAMLAMVAIMVIFPDLATWLPNQMLGQK